MTNIISYAVHTEYEEENNVYIGESSGQAEEEDLEENNLESKLWTDKLILYLINCVKEHDGQFERDIKKNVWSRIAKLCTQFVNKKITAVQCDNKWRSLKRRYKTILEHNKTSGKSRKQWEYYSVMHEIMHKKPEINPVATCSSSAGLRSNFVQNAGNENLAENDESNLTESPVSLESPKASGSSSYMSSFARQRSNRASQLERRHREKMQRLDRFNDLFEEYISKLPNANAKD